MDVGMTRRYLQIEDSLECHGKFVTIFCEMDVPMPYKPPDGPPARAPETWAWGFDNSERESGEIETIYLGFKDKQAAIDDAFEYRQSMLEDIE